MRIALFAIALFACFLNTFLILDISWLNNTVVPANKNHVGIFLKEQIKAGRYGPLSGLIVQQGKYVIFKQSPPSTGPHSIQSVTKSITSLVIGIAIKRGDIKSVNQTVLSFFPEYKSKVQDAWDNITIKDLLTMRSGIDWDEDKRPEHLNPTFQMYSAVNAAEFIFSRKLSQQKQFNYSSANAALLSHILFKLQGKTFAEYANEVLFGPLEIKNYIWTTYKNGVTNTSGGLHLTLEDLAKIGQLCLQKGKWKGKEIVDPGWISDSFKSSSELTGYLDVNAYGYMWWIHDFCIAPETGKCIKVYKACGFHNNHILIIPDYDILVVMLGNSDTETEKYLNLLHDVLTQIRSL